MEKQIKPYKHNKYDLNSNIGIGWTINTNKEFYFDKEDYEKIKDYCWREHINKDGYCSLEANNINHTIIRFHWVLGCKGYDHIDRNPLNNQKSNLRKATAVENTRNRNKQRNNTSGIIGVCWAKGRNKWQATVKVDKKNKHLGYFEDFTEAVKARLKGEKKYYGEFAPQQFLFEKYAI